MEQYKMLFYSLASIDNFIPLEQRINLFFPINKHIFTVLEENGHHSTIFFFLSAYSIILETAFKVGQDRTI